MISNAIKITPTKLRNVKMQNRIKLDNNGMVIGSNSTIQLHTPQRIESVDQNTMIFDSLCEIKELLANIRDIELPKIQKELSRISDETDENSLKLTALAGTVNRIADKGKR
jgi:hypothetical protein